MSLRPEHLMSFCVVAQSGSVSQAADALGLSQPAVSRQLASLQEALGHTLYTRTAYGVTLTPMGKALLPYACTLRQTFERAQEVAAGDATSALELKLGLSHHLVTRYTGRLLHAAKRNASQTLHLEEGYSRPLIKRVEAEQLDAALVLSSDTSSTPLLAKRMGEDEVCLLVKSDDPIGAQSYVPSSELRGETLILPSSQSWVYARLREHLEMAQVRTGRLLEVSGPAAVHSAVLDGLGIGLTLKSFVLHGARAGLLRCVGLEETGFQVGVWLVSYPLTGLASQRGDALRALLEL